MRFQMPEKLDELSLEDVTKLYEAALAEAQELNAIADKEITADQKRDLVALVGLVGQLNDQIAVLEVSAEPTEDEIAAARALLAPKAEAEVETEEVDENVDLHVDDEAEAEVETEEKELVAAGAPGKRVTFASRAKANTKAAEEAPKEDPKIALKASALSIRAAANIRSFTADQELDLDQLTEAYISRAGMYAGGGRQPGRKSAAAVRSGVKSGSVATSNFLSENMQRFAVARLEKPANEFTIPENASPQVAYDMIRAAASEQRLAGGSLRAAGGWCAPSTIIFGFLELETSDGLLSVPELNAPRGGIQFTKGPQLGDLLIAASGGTFGWDMTEATVEAGATDKPVFDIDCPDWDEVRLRAAGWALRVGLLTETAYSELVKRYLGLGLVTHARLMNQRVISGISSAISTTYTFANVHGATATIYSATADLLGAIELYATYTREKYSMALNATVEAVFPIWVPMVIRAELSRRSEDGTLMSVPDSMIVQWFKDRKINPQFVRDYQSINNGALTVAGGTGTWTAVPTHVEFMMYPAGSFVKLASPVIDLDAVYDTDNLTKNRYMAAFFEEGYAIANTGADGIKVDVALGNIYGLTGGKTLGS